MSSLDTYDFENGDILKPIQAIKPEKSTLRILKMFIANVREVLFGNKLSVLLPLIPLAIVAQFYDFGSPWIFALSLVGLAPLAERKQVDANSLLLLLGLLCQILPLMFKYGGMEVSKLASSSVLEISRASSIVMLIAYFAYLFFQLKTHTQVFELQEEELEGKNEEIREEKEVIGFWSAFVWLVVLTVIIAILSEYVVDTIQVASDTWGISVSFISIILLPIVGNAAEHAGSIIFACKNKLDISLGVAMGSATQISMFLVPLCVIVGWIMGIPMSLDFGLLETGCLAFSILLTALTLQDGRTDTRACLYGNWNMFLCSIWSLKPIKCQ